MSCWLGQCTNVQSVMLLSIETKRLRSLFRYTTWSIHVVWCFWMGRRLLDSWPIRWQDHCPGMVFWAKSLWSLAGPIVCKSYKMCVYDLVGEDVVCCNLRTCACRFVCRCILASWCTIYWASLSHLYRSCYHKTYKIHYPSEDVVRRHWPLSLHWAVRPSKTTLT